jgi:RNA recognition motif-containing protein
VRNFIFYLKSSKKKTKKFYSKSNKTKEEEKITRQKKRTKQNIYETKFCLILKTKKEEKNCNMDLCSNNSSLSSSLSVSISNTSSNNNLDFATTSTNISENTSKTNLIVNYLPQTMVREEFEALFASIGELQSCTLILDKFHIPSIENQQQLNLGYGFVDYVRSDHANEAIRLLNGLRIENKTLKVSFARPSSNTIKGANLFVCNMPKNWTSDDMTRVFSSCGVVITSRVLSKKAKSNESKGVGFVRFDRRSEVIGVKL